MQIIEFPERENWARLLQRPTLDTTFLERTVSIILKDVSKNGDAALRKYACEFDKVELDEFRVTDMEFDEADSLVPDDLKAAIEPRRRILKVSTISKGDHRWSKRARCRLLAAFGGDRKVGLYVPAGSAHFFLRLMLAIPQRSQAVARL